MELITFEDYISNKTKDELICCLGQFDGIHLGHLALINKTIEEGSKNNLKTALITFEPHPQVVLCDNYDGELTSIEEKEDFLKSFKLDYIIVINFTKELAAKDHKTFVKEYLMPLNIKECIVGFDYSYGYKGLGKADNITIDSDNMIKTIIISKVEKDNEKVSSSRIRKLLQEGEIEKANELLGHPLSLKGKVKHGRRVGTTINFPTINIDVLDGNQSFKKGVYAVIVNIENINYIGMLNIGNNPSFNYQENISFEIHVLGYDDDCYNKDVKFTIYKFIRPETKFESKEAFLKQIEKDKITIKEYFKKNSSINLQKK